MKKNCVFCNINKKEYIFENKYFFVVLDKNPITKGHCLIISKDHFTNIFDANMHIFDYLGEIFQFLTSKFKEKYGFKDFNILHASGKNAQQSIGHLHMHFVPRYKDDNIDLWLKNKK